MSHAIPMMDVLKKETVHMKDCSHVEKIILQLVNGGASRLQVISDFDHTLSRFHKDGFKCQATYDIFEQAPFLTEDYRYQCSCLYNHYYSIEMDPNLTKTEKIPYMIEWYNKGQSLMPLSGINKDSIPEMVGASNFCFRDGCTHVFESLHKHNVPLLIFSAGLGDILNGILKKQKLFFPNMKVIANFLRFDDQNKLLGYKGDIIHMFNKNQSSIVNSDYFDMLKTRTNILLLGDSLGDVGMSEGAENVNVILRIGFLNHRIEEYLPEYLNCYDIVLTDDQTMDIVSGLLSIIL